MQTCLIVPGHGMLLPSPCDFFKSPLVEKLRDLLLALFPLDLSYLSGLRPEVHFCAAVFSSMAAAASHFAIMEGSLRRPAPVIRTRFFFWYQLIGLHHIMISLPAILIRFCKAFETLF